MPSSQGRRAFLLGITLNELSFIMFFLLMLVSSISLQKSQKKLEDAIAEKVKAQHQMGVVKQDLDKTFKRLQLIEQGLRQAAGFRSMPTDAQLNEMFEILREARTNGLVEANQTLKKQVNELESFRKLSQLLDESGVEKKATSVQQLIVEVKDYQENHQLLQGRFAYLKKQLKNNGLDHPPCWANAKTGAIEYLYSIQLHQDGMRIKPAWPAYRKKDLQTIPGIHALIGNNISIEQLQKSALPVFEWSKQHDCRHFVRIKDDQSTSKDVFKKQLFAVEKFFYKLMT